MHRDGRGNRLRLGGLGHETRRILFRSSAAKFYAMQCGRPFYGDVNMMQPGFIPFHTDFNDTAVDRAKDFCRTRELTPAMVKIRRNGDMVEVVVKKPCLMNKGGKCG